MGSMWSYSYPHFIEELRFREAKCVSQGHTVSHNSAPEVPSLAFAGHRAKIQMGQVLRWVLGIQR